MREHELSQNCWCEPRQDDEEPSLWIHNEVDMTTETPRTDAVYWAGYPNGKEAAAWDFARFLEQENAQMRATLEDIYDALQSNPLNGPQKYVMGDDMIYLLDGQRMYFALNKARVALGR